MQFEKGNIYHIYNQGNNQQKIFFTPENYLFFLGKIKTHISPFADIFAWCLMPNHFHFMVLVKDVEIMVEVKEISQGLTQSQALTKKLTFNDSLGIMLRSYTRAINKQNRTTGSLFRKASKVECLNSINNVTQSFYTTEKGAQIHIDNPDKDYPQLCFNYIHYNPVKAKLVRNETDWEFSSAKDYAGLRNGKLVNKEKAKEYIIF